MKFALAPVLLCVSTVAAVAQDDGLQWYSGLRGSVAFDGTINAKANTTPPDTVKINLNAGGGASVFWGFRLPQGFSTELELLYRYAPLGDGVVNGLSGSLDGYAQMIAPMVNAYWTAPVDFPVKPYVGAGIGYGWNEVGLSGISGTSFPTVHDDGWRMAYNLMAGIVIPADDRSRFTIGYRWLHEDIGIDCSAGVSCSGNMNSSSIDLGFSLDLE